MRLLKKELEKHDIVSETSISPEGNLVPDENSGSFGIKSVFNYTSDLIVLCDNLKDMLYEKRALFATKHTEPSAEFEQGIQHLKVAINLFLGKNK
jgi:hypothetical protein